MPAGLFSENDETYARTDELCQKLSLHNLSKTKSAAIQLIFACVFFSFCFELVVKNATAVFSPVFASSERLNFCLQNTTLRSKGMLTIPGQF